MCIIASSLFSMCVKNKRPDFYPASYSDEAYRPPLQRVHGCDIAALWEALPWLCHRQSLYANRLGQRNEIVKMSRMIFNRFSKRKRDEENPGVLYFKRFRVIERVTDIAFAPALLPK